MRNFERPFTPPFGLKLWENAFQMIPDISLFDAEKKLLATFFDKNVRQQIVLQKIDKLPVFEDLCLSFVNS